MPKKIVIAAGGTGGHLFPAQVVARELGQHLPGSDVLFLAKGLSINPCFCKSEFCYKEIPASQISLRACIRASFDIPRGVVKSMKAMKAFSPDVVVGFGSFHTFPVLVAAYLLGIPMILHVADSIPGRVNRLFSSKAAWNGVFFPDAAAHLQGTIKKTSLPLRKEFYESCRPSRKEACAYYGLDSSKKTVLVFGGSQGAKNLNSLIADALCHYAQKETLQVLHFTGTHGTKVSELYAQAGIFAVVQPFEKSMHYAWAAADIVISRSGASTLAEQMAFAVPAILIPYPHAKDQHQQKNAAFVEETFKGAKVIEERELTTESLLLAIEALLSEEASCKMKKSLAAANRQMQQESFSKQIADFLMR
jgi:UDP-N-acetylglucosamine--N-acetylmuramyl-(pentapeptide) pyrophosphoryl-undecaprenol N-acetylglucosamine transferase